jgi:putative ABC transport system permease protein
MSTIPFAYNLESLRARWRSALVAVLGIAGTVAVFIAMLALAKGFRATLVSSGSPENAIVRRAGATSEMDSVIGLDELRALEDYPQVARDDHGAPLSSAEVVVTTALPLRSTGTDATVQIRGVSPGALSVRRQVRLAEGRFFREGLPELVVGRHALDSYSGLELGKKASLGGLDWDVVGVLDGGGSAYDSELWGDVGMVAQVYQRPRSIFQSATLRLTSPEALEGLKAAVASDPRLDVQVESEVEYYERESVVVRGMILGLGMLVAGVMGVGAIFGALNTMYGAVAERTREIATLRAIGFSEGAVVSCFVLEALLIAAVGGGLGCLLVLPVNGLTTGTMNWQTFSHLAFAFQVTSPLLLAGVGFALAMGIAGGLPPAIRAARLPAAAALRDL